MKPFHLFTVRALEVLPTELPRVRYGDYFVCADSLQDAYAAIREEESVRAASEVYGMELSTPPESKPLVLVRPASKLHTENMRGAHVDWQASQTSYVVLHKAPF
jgi:hypothetical protein